MIEVLDGFPDDVVAYVCHGRIDESDYTRVVADIVEKLDRHNTLRMYCEVAADYTGAGGDTAWQDWQSTFRSWFHWERGAIVTDVDWMRWATAFFGVLLPGQWRVFPPADKAAARNWIVEPSAVS